MTSKSNGNSTCDDEIDQRFPIGSSIDLGELDRDPFPIYARLRESEPISYVPALKMYLVTRYKDAEAVMQDTQRFIVGTEKSTVFDTFGAHMMTVEGDLHTRYKGAHREFFLPKTIRSQLEGHILEHTGQLIDEFEARGEIDLRPDFASRLPILTMLSLFGLDADEETHLQSWYYSFEAALSNFTWDEEIRRVARRNTDSFHKLIQSYLDKLRVDGEDTGSLLSALVNAASGERLTDEEIRRNALIVFFGGISTVEALILNTLFALSSHPEMLARVRADREQIGNALAETIRWLGPVQSATRHVACDTEFRGISLSKGDTVNCMLGSANRDSEMFVDPDRFDIDRRNARRHLGFARGPHHCLGSKLARAEARIAIDQLLSRLPDFRLDLDRVEGPSGYEFRQPTVAMATWQT